MKIVDLAKEYEPLYFVCLENWSEDMKEAGNHKKTWYNNMLSKGLRVKLAINDAGNAVGMIEYLPIEHSIAQGQDLYYINCIWVHGHMRGVGDQRRRGYGLKLLQAAEADAKALGAKGMAAHGITLPFWIPASFFKKQGYKAVDKQGIMRLLFKPFSTDAQKPKIIRQRQKVVKNANPGKVTVTYFLTGSCPACSMVYERAKRAAAEFGDQVVFQTVDTCVRETYLRCGMQNNLYVEDKLVSNGPPLSYDKIKAKIEKRVQKLKA